MRLEFDAFRERVGLHRRMLVVAPHPDDETIGCGGLIALARLSGVDVHVVLVTDGSASHPASRAWPPQRIAAQRKQELVDALGLLGVHCAPTFLDLPDARTPSLPANMRIAACARLSAVIAALSPDAVLTTWRREPHCDHRFSYELTRDAMHMAGCTAPCLEYMVWTYLSGAADDRPDPAVTMCLQLDIETVRENKRAALSMHVSQLGGMIVDDPEGFALTSAQLETMISGDEQFEIALVGY